MTEVAELKQAARATWAAGDYDEIAEKIWDVGGRLVSRLDVGPGEDVLDVACGTGNAAIPAALAGARVVGVDLTPELFAAARARAAAAAVDVTWVEGDAEALSFADESFDVVVSTFGAMFAPRHEVAAAELARVLRPGGRLGLCSWTPEGEVGEFFRLVADYVPPPPTSVPPTLWGSEKHVRGLLEGSGLELSLRRERVTMSYDSVEQAVELYATKFGPVVMAREQLEPEGRWPALRDDLARMFERHDASVGTAPGIVFSGEYLVAVGRRPGGGVTRR